MAEVQGEKPHGEEVETGNHGVLETHDDHLVNVAYGGELPALSSEFEARVGDAEGVVKEMVDDEGQNSEPAVDHGTR